MKEDIGLLKTAIPYIRAYKNKVFVVKLGGQVCRPGEVLQNVVEQLALLYQLGIKVVVVHGGGEQASTLGEKLGITPTFVNGRRVTTVDALEVAKMSFAGVVNTDILAAFRRNEVPAVGLSGIDGNLIHARRRPVGEVRDRETGENSMVDFGLVGDIIGADISLLRHMLDGGYVPVVCSIAADENGQVLNVNADTIAATISIAIAATKYCLLSTVDGVMRDINDPSSLCSYLDLTEVERLMDQGVVRGGMLPKLAACVAACKGGVPRVHIINGLEPDALLEEIFTNEGCGTLIVAEREQEQSSAVST